MPSASDLTNINYAFATINDTFDGIKIANPERLHRIVKLKETNPDLEVQLSIGGGGAGGFSEMAANKKLRKKFVADCKRAVEEFGLDGVDIDWEYPTLSIGGGAASPKDTKNFTQLMKDLRKALPRPLLLTMASGHTGKYIDFPSVIKYLDFVNIMAYDMGKPPRHHSPLHRSDKTGSMSAEIAVRSHLDRGVPPNKIVLGIPFYGIGTGPYRNGVLYRDIKLAEGCSEQWDSVAGVPYIADSTGALVLTYDDPRSIALKCDFIRENGLLGAMYWNYESDNRTGDLRKAVADGILRQKQE